ncbi:MAG: hypothetical protein IIC73_01410 [Armatimonadetes bacterium]|nr:hypothetical protein [Armatimonadota bacterium]
MGRLSTSILLCAVAGACCAQPFGRFGYKPFPSVPGFTITADGFRSSSSGADTLRFVRPLQGFTAFEVSDRAALFTGPRFALAPQKFRVDLRSPGFEMYFPYGFQFTVTSLRNPFLSWSEGSVGPDVPTPESKWVLVSFQDRQPPIMLVFDKLPSGVVVRGSAGQWRIETTGHFEGWIRFCLPLGQYARPGMSAASLGRIVQDEML